MNTHSFTAVDFETATSDRMICEIGIVVVKDNKIVKKYRSLVQPPENRYDAGCIRTHHITASKTKDSPELDELWPDIKQYFTGRIVAHKASFDRDALTKSLEYYNIPTDDIPSFDCTCNFYSNATLGALCAGFDIDYDADKHHSAEYDAECCAQFAIHMYNEDEPDWSKVEAFYERIGKVFSRKSGSSSSSRSHSRSISGDLLKQDLSHADPSNPFYDKKVVITGTFRQDRMELAERVKKMGAKLMSKLSRNADIVLMGANAGPSKVQKIEEWKAEGVNIRVIKQKALDTILGDE